MENFQGYSIIVYLTILRKFLLNLFHDKILIIRTCMINYYGITL